jgi:hypothetical protein
MAKNKTTQTAASVTAFIDKVADERKRKDSFLLIDLIKGLTGLEPVMWGPGIVGFGNYHYKYESGREGDAPLVGLSPRKAAIVVYLSSNFDKREELLLKLGKHTTGVGCLYIKKLEDVDIEVLKKMIVNSVKHMQKLYPSK